MQEIWKWANLTLAFGMELVALGALAVWGWKTGDGTPTKLALAVGVPVVAAVAWGLFAAPHASFGNPVLAIVTKVVVFGGAALALWAVNYRAAAVVFVVVVVTNLLAIKLGHLSP
ncbi:YrdB family protein [Nocardia jejuensis]|uniref:YrdB family protein n=1 Tax=Nocardia jejuensis TaxID=328049 RepID=UPI00082DCB0E|nr:YrdB family protein [Nocardia jejuensis]